MRSQSLRVWLHKRRRHSPRIQSCAGRLCFFLSNLIKSCPMGASTTEAFTPSPVFVIGEGNGEGDRWQQGEGESKEGDGDSKVK